MRWCILDICLLLERCSKRLEQYVECRDVRIEKVKSDMPSDLCTLPYLSNAKECPTFDSRASTKWGASITLLLGQHPYS